MAETVSVVIPAYNAGRYVRAAVESVLAQDYPAIEVIVVDDGSTDDTAEVLRQFGDRIRVIRQANAGVAAACNAGARAASGPWLALLDADDEWLPDKLSQQVARCGAFAVSHTDSVCFGEGLERETRRSSFEPPHAGRVLPQLLVRNFITKSSVLMRTAAYRAVGGFDESLPGVEDWPLWIALCKDHELGYLPEPVVRYRVHRQSKSMQVRKTLRDHERIIAAAFAPGGAGAAFPALRREALLASYEIHCHYALEAGDWRLAARCAAGVLARRPRDVGAWKALVKSLLMPFGYRY
ncbi:MAG: glycosyltransferase [Proteobacteria bacterium]|nr:glycosyltransferase [Pseudomonadota bacterium]